MPTSPDSDRGALAELLLMKPVQRDVFVASTYLKGGATIARLPVGADRTTVRKTILGHEDHSATSSSNEWLGVETIAGIAVTSEADDAPIENVLYPDGETGWRAGKPGPQIIQITFSGPRGIRRIQLVFRESQLPRTQEFRLRCSVAGGEWREVIRQQWTFSPQGSTEEFEDYRVTLEDVAVLELAINPDISNRGAHASLLRLRIG